jgi:hypothetical protein
MESTRNSSYNAIGGDTITFDKTSPGDWVQSIRPMQNWRIINYRKLRLLSEVPDYALDMEIDQSSSKRATGAASGLETTTTIRKLLRRRLKVSIVTNETRSVNLKLIQIDL